MGKGTIEPLRETETGTGYPGRYINREKRMGEVVRFRHARASAGSGTTGNAACMVASASKVTSTKPRLSAMRTNGSQYSPPIRPRCAHLLMAVAEMSSPSALKSSDAASSEGQSAKRSRGVSSMDGNLGPFVLNVKANMSCDDSVPPWHISTMPDRMTETEERASFIGRTKAARMARYETQKPMLTILGIDQGTYKQYETRTPLPHRFIPKFCAATGVDLEWLLTGEGAGPKTVPLPSTKRARGRPSTAERRRSVA